MKARRIFLILITVLTISIKSSANSSFLGLNGYSIKELLQSIGLLEVQTNGYLGNGVNIVVIDTGVSNHKDLSENVIYFKDFVNAKSEKYDDNGHGTQVSGIISGTGKMSNNKYTGVAPKGKLIILKVFDINGIGNLIDLSESIDWIVENREKFNIKLVCMSFGFDASQNFDNIILKSLVEKLWDNNVLLVTSAGNDGVNGKITLPGIYSNVVTAGSVKYEPSINKNIYESEISDFSSRINSINSNDKPDLYSPGESIITTGKDGNYISVNGTSFSAAIVCGQVALLLEKYPDKNVNQIYELIHSMTYKKFLLLSHSKGSGIIE